MSIIFELISLILQQLQQTFLEFELIEGPISPSDAEPCPAEPSPSVKPHEMSWAADEWPQSEEADAFLFKHAFREDSAKSATQQDHASVEGGTVYDLFMTLLKFGDTETELANMKIEFDLSFGMVNSTQSLAFEIWA